MVNALRMIGWSPVWEFRGERREIPTPVHYFVPGAGV